jgi:hypothetical protein
VISPIEILEVAFSAASVGVFTNRDCRSIILSLMPLLVFSPTKILEILFFSVL